MAPTIRIRQPTAGLELALDPRLPPESQAFRFLLDGVNPGDTVSWTIDNGIMTPTMKVKRNEVEKRYHNLLAAHDGTKAKVVWE